MPKTAKSSADQVPAAEPIALSPAAQRAWREGQSFEQYVTSLLNENLVHDAVRVLSAALAPRDLIWWSALCIWAVKGSALSSAEDGALRAVVHWVFDPSIQRHAETVKCRAKVPPESAAYAMATGVMLADQSADPNQPNSASNLKLGRRATQAAIFEMIATAPQADLKRYLAFFGLTLLKTPNHWAA